MKYNKKFNLENTLQSVRFLKEKLFLTKKLLFEYST